MRGETALERLEEGRRRRAGLQFRDRRLGQELRLVGQRSQARLHEIRADVEEQQQTRQQEERDDEQHRDDADEHVREDELPTHAPEQPAPRPEREARQPVRARENQREAADHVDGFDRPWQRLAQHGLQRPRDRLDDGADQERAAGEGAEQPPAPYQRP